MSKKKKKKLWIAAGCVLVLIVLVVLILESRFVKQKILSSAERYLQETQGIQLTVESFDYDLLRLQFILKGIQIQKWGKTPYPPVFRAEMVRINIPLSLLLRRRLQIQELEIVNPEISIFIDRKGSSNLPVQAGEKKSQPTPRIIPDFLVEKLDVRNMQLKFTDESSHFEVGLFGIGIIGEGDASGMHALLFEMQQDGIIKFHERTIPLNKWLIQAKIEKETLDIERWLLSSPKNEIEFIGQVRGFSSLNIEGKTQGHFDLEEILAIVAVDNPISGNVEFSSDLKGSLKDIEAHIGIKSEDVKIGKIGEFDVGAELDWKNESLEVRSFDIQKEEAEIFAQGFLHPFQWDEGNHLSVRWKNIDLEIFTDFIRSPYPVSTASTGSMDMTWNGFSLDEVNGECDVRFIPTEPNEIQSEGVPLEGHLVAKADAGRVEIRIQDISLFDTNVNGKFLLSPGDVSGDVGLEVQSAGRLMPLINVLDKDPGNTNLEKLGIDGAVSISASLNGSFKAPHVSIDFDSTSFQIAGTENLKIEGRALYDHQALQIESFRIEDKEGKIEISGMYPITTAGQNMRFDVHGESLSVMRILAIMDSKLDGKGTIQFEAVLEGTPDAPKMESKWLVSDTSLFEEYLGEVEIKVHYQQGKIICDSLSINKASGLLEASGFYDLQKDAIKVNLAGKSFPLDGLKVVEDLDRIRAELDVDFEASGDLKNIRMKTEGKLSQLFLGSHSLSDWNFKAQSHEEKIDFRVEAPLFASVIDGTISLENPYGLMADLSINEIFLEELKSNGVLDWKNDLSGSVTADVHLSMDLADPVKTLTCDTAITNVQLQSKDRLLQNEGPILLSYRDETLRVDRFLLAGEGARIAAEGTLPLNAPSASKISLTAAVDLALLSGLNPFKECGGSLQLETQLLGSLLDLEIDSVIDLRDARFQTSLYPLAIEDLQAHLEIKRNLVQIDSISGRMAESRFDLKGEIPFTSFPFSLPVQLHDFGEEKARLVFEFEDWDPFTLQSLIPHPVSQKIRGRFGGHIELEGMDFALENMSVKGIFSTLDLQVSGISLSQDAPSRISLEGGMLSIEHLSLKDNQNLLKFGGSANLRGEGELNLSVDGAVEMELLRIFLQEEVLSGNIDFQIHVARSFKNPEIQGFIDIREGRYQRIAPNLVLEQVAGRIKLMGTQAEIEEIRGILNGGKTVVSGQIGLSGWPFPEGEIGLKFEESFFDYPKGLYSKVSADLKLISDGNNSQTLGTVTVLDARYREDFKVGSTVFNLLKKGSGREIIGESDPFLKKLNLDINIDIPRNFIIDNNIAKADISGELRIVGTPYNLGLAGRVGIAEGGEVYFNQNTFSIEQGTVDFISPIRIEPDLNLSARTQVLEYDIQLIVQGTPDKLTASLVSDPVLSEPNIISLLVMGRTLESASSSVASMAGSTALSYLNNAITGKIEQATARAFGLESVRIDAGLISTEENPEARITIGQHLSRNIELVFSQDLKNTRNQLWMLNYNPIRSFNIQGIKRDNNELNLALRHEIQFGLKSAPDQIPVTEARIKEVKLGNVQLEGDLKLPESVVLRSSRLKKGKKINFSELQTALERIRRLFLKNNYLSLSLSTRRETKNGELEILLSIDSGPKIYLDYEGDQIPKNMKKGIVETWFGSPFGGLAVRDIEQRIEAHFMEKGFYQTRIESNEEWGEKGERILVFKTSRGPRFGKPEFRITGNSALSGKSIETHLEKSGALNKAFYRPREWVRSIEEFYMLHGYLRPIIEMPTVQFLPEEHTASIEVSVEEGRAFKVGAIQIDGLQFFSEEEVLKEISIFTGHIISPEKLNQIEYKIYDLYVQMGFNDIRVQSDFRVNSESHTVDLNLDIQENQRGIITEIGILGNTLTDDKTILREVTFEKGDIVNFREINATRKGLYDLGVFERVNIDITPWEPEETNPEKISEAADENEKYFQVTINVIEIRPYRLRYGFEYDTESSFGVLASLINRNFLGSANLLGGSFRINRDERETRAFFRSPYFLFRKISTEIFFFNKRSIKQAFTLERTGVTLQQQLKTNVSNMISYNYTLEQIDTLYPMLYGIQSMDVKDRIGTLNVSFTRDTRDNVVNATRGIFFSQSLRYAPGIFGSDVRFIRYFGQYNAYRKLSDQFVYAASARIGLGKSFNGDLPASEKFFAGGGTTVRGFKKDELGPRDPLMDFPLGGDAVFLLNQELRFPIYKKLGGVIFLDLGNVYPGVSDMDFSDIRETAGFGFRLHFPYVLVRFDWGFKLDRRPGESLSRIFLSIGQAF